MRGTLISLIVDSGVIFEDDNEDDDDEASRCQNLSNFSCVGFICNLKQKTRQSISQLQSQSMDKCGVMNHCRDRDKQKERKNSTSIVRTCRLAVVGRSLAMRKTNFRIVVFLSYKHYTSRFLVRIASKPNRGKIYLE